MKLLTVGSSGFLCVVAVSLASAQGSSRYPFVAPPLRDSAEIAIALTAAPPSISADAAVYAIRDGAPTKIREGHNGCACMVGRDLHEGSLYPICFDAEGTRTRLWRELLENQLRVQGRTEAEVKRAVAEAYAKGRLKSPAHATVAYMMSPLQVLFSTADSSGRRVGAWSPHLMILAPGMTSSTLGMINGSAAIVAFSAGEADNGLTELVVKTITWSDGSAAKR